MDLHVPLAYATGGDLLTYCETVKRMTQGWVLYLPNLGAPYGANWADFPTADWLHLVLLNVIALVSPDFGTTINLYFLLGFPLSTIAAVWAMRHFEVSWGPAVVSGILFSFLPYHLLRGEVHLMLSSYYLVPPIIAVVLWVTEKREIVSRHAGRIPFRVERRYGVAALVIAVLTGSNGIYYAYFSCFLLAVAAVIVVGEYRSWKPAVPAVLLITVIIGSVWVNTLPHRIYDYLHGPNQQAVLRNNFGVELYSLRITQLLLPVTNHWIPFLANVKSAYNQMWGSPWINENDSASLGLIGASGFLLLVGCAFWRSCTRLMGTLALLNVGCVLLATISGFSSVLALLGLNMIRGYTRISVYIAFLSFFAVGLILTRAERWFCRHTWGSPAFCAFLAVAAAAGVVDQTGMTAHYGTQYALDKETFATDKEFVNQIEKALPPNAMVFQLPYMSFPEAGSINRMIDYDPFRASLHSRTLRWSYGSMRGRGGDEFARRISDLAPDAMVEQLTAAHFAGIYVDRFGYKDLGIGLERALTSLLGPPMVRHDGRISFFKLVSRRGPGEAASAPKELDPSLIEMRWSAGCYPLETDGNRRWRWCSSNAELELVNRTAATQKLDLHMVLATNEQAHSVLDVVGPQFHEADRVSATPVVFQKTLVIPPGRSTIEFRSNAQPPVVPGDPRTMVFRVEDFTSNIIGDAADK